MRFAMPVDTAGNWADPVTGRTAKIREANPRRDLVEILPDGNHRLHPLPEIMGPDSVHNQMTYQEFQENTQNINPQAASDQYARYILEEMMPKN